MIWFCIGNIIILVLKCIQELPVGEPIDTDDDNESLPKEQAEPDLPSNLPKPTTLFDSSCSSIEQSLDSQAPSSVIDSGTTAAQWKPKPSLRDAYSQVK